MCVSTHPQWVFTSDEGKRGGRTLPLKQIVDRAVAALAFVERVFMFKRTGNADVAFDPTIDVDMTVELPKHRPYCPPVWVDSEDLMFILYTSGSTGTPKGIAHTTAGYLLYTMVTAKYSFDLQPDDVFACVADCGWITGHSYVVYGPLANGVTTVMFESTPTYPDCGRYWDLVQRHRVTKFYTAPTAIRALMAHGDADVKKYDRSSLKVLGTVGEPINPEVRLLTPELAVGRREGAEPSSCGVLLMYDADFACLVSPGVEMVLRSCWRQQVLCHGHVLADRDGWTRWRGAAGCDANASWILHEAVLWH